MAQVVYELQLPIEVGLEKCGTGLDEATKNIRIGDKLQSPLPKGYEDWWIFSLFRFPIADMSKKDLLKEAKIRGYDDILSQVWYCWFPNEVGEPCGKCNMCLEHVSKLL